LTGYKDRTVRDKLKAWIECSFLEPTDPTAQRIRAIKLSKKYQKPADEVAKEPNKYKYLLI